MEAVFLGINDAGEQIYNWLNQQEDVEVKALLTEKDQLGLIKELEPEIVISAGFEHKVPEEIIEIPEKGVVNVHPSLLPYNRGSYPYMWPLLDGTPAGVSIHYMAEGIDEGPIIDQMEVPVKPEDTAKDLYERLKSESVLLFKEAWPEIKKGVKGRSQDLSTGQTHYRNELDDVAEIDLDEKVRAGDLIDRLRALSFPPHENGFFEVNGQKYFVEIDITPETELQNSEDL
ncbi:methionyl-tRNA formyltransferase [Candidatus Nanohalovita haloferacivicina]|uniref:methionyl-tRNA formyltransferase n=1 Tax=Candidatus Nanohalovita haloferacivicina TaxID=2978046 RepID=UPI00325FAE33|nr:dTDP-4-amino-4,6-dideoxyglucose formyltransferase [Candidatus Nanohalobia archaeon BNXNv]